MALDILHHGDAVIAAVEAGTTRFRPVIMTALAMIIGMIPMALGLGELRSSCEKAPVLVSRSFKTEEQQYVS
jgi:multidrug efflux pump subunit AcrB